ncbi:MAG: autotransporter outer membrane beta-barrel domain-containing protein, partial [Verrucomicrobiota bacterium]
FNVLCPDGATDLLQVTGTATLNGILHIDPIPGVYLEGTTYTILTAATTTGQFSSSFSNQPLDYTINYFPTQVQLFLLKSSLMLPIPNTALSGNARAVAQYLFCNSFDFSNTDLNAVVNALVGLPINEYVQALNKLTPSSFGALPLMELENNFNIANTFFVAGAGQRSYCYIDMNEPTSIWINPLGFIYSQKGRQEAPGFTSHTYGVAGGIDHLFSDYWSMGLGIGYSHEQLHWQRQVGRAHADSVYLGPYLKYDSTYFYFDFLVLGAGNFYDVDRKIVFPGFSREADSNPTTWNLSEILLGGVRLEFYDVHNFFIQPEIMLDQLNIFQEGFQEKGANSIDLSVERKYSSFLRSLVNTKLVKEWVISNVCLVPSINVGWLRTTPLTGGHYTASFRADTTCAPDFTVTSFHKAIDQLLIGAQFLLSCQGDFQLSIGYEGKFGEGTKVNEVNLGMRWRF